MRLIIGFVTVLLCLGFGYTPATSQCKPVSPGFVHGRVVDLLGGPISEAEVTLQMRDSDKTMSATSDADGCYKFKEKFEGNFTITARSRGFAVGKANGSIFESYSKNIDFGLEVGQIMDWPSITVIGEIKRGKVKAKFATVEIFSVYNHTLSERVTADEHGRFKVNVRNSGRYIIYGLDEKGVGTSTISIEGSTKDQVIKVNIDITDW